MFKVIVVLFLTITVSFCSFAIFFVPKKFHHQIHQVLIPKLSKDSVKTYKKINRAHHETVVQTEKHLSTIMSFSGVNPFEYYVVVKIRDLATMREVEARISAEVSDHFELHADLKDYNNEDHDNGLAFKKARIVLSAPTKVFFIDEAKRALFLLTNTKLNISVKELSGVWSVDGGLKESSSTRIDDLSWVLRAKSLVSDERLKIVSKLKIKAVEFSFPKNKGRYEDLEQSLVFDSFSKAGFKEKFETIKDVIGKRDDSPTAYKILTMIPVIKSLLSFPFEISHESTLRHKAGPGKLNFSILIQDIEVHGLYDALRLNLEASFPRVMVEPYAVLTLAGEYTKVYKDRFYPADLNTPDTVSDYAEMSKLRALAEVRLKSAFENFFYQESGGKKRIDRVVDVAIAGKMIAQKDGVFSLRANYEKKQLKLNDKPDQLDKLKTVIPFQEVGDYLLANGFIAIKRAEDP